MKVLELISGKKAPRYAKNPSLEVQIRDNWACVVRFMASLGIEVPLGGLWLSLCLLCIVLISSFVVSLHAVSIVLFLACTVHFPFGIYCLFSLPPLFAVL